MKEKKIKKVNLLELRKINTKNGKKEIIQFSKGVTILFNGQEVDMGEYGTFFLKRKEELVTDLEFLASNEYIDEKTLNERLARLETKEVIAAAVVPLK